MSVTLFNVEYTERERERERCNGRFHTRLWYIIFRCLIFVAVKK